MDVRIKSFFWRDFVSDEATYQEYIGGVLTSAEDIVIELDENRALRPEGPGPPEGYIQLEESAQWAPWCSTDS